MKILIIATPRSGSNHLHRTLKKSVRKDALLFNEPFNLGGNTHSSFDKIKLPNDCIVKSIIDQIPSQLIPDTKNRLDSRNIDKEHYYIFTNFYVNYCKSFDKIILLDRHNKVDVYESLQYRLDIQSLAGEQQNWNTRYYIDNIDFIPETYSWVEYMKNSLLTLSEQLDIPITWYENLFSGYEELVAREVKKWNLKESYTALDFDNKGKYRQFKPVISLNI